MSIFGIVGDSTPGTISVNGSRTISYAEISLGVSQLLNFSGGKPHNGYPRNSQSIQEREALGLNRFVAMVIEDRRTKRTPPRPSGTLPVHAVARHERAGLRSSLSCPCRLSLRCYSSQQPCWQTDDLHVTLRFMSSRTQRLTRDACLMDLGRETAPSASADRARADRRGPWCAELRRLAETSGHAACCTGGCPFPRGRNYCR